MNAKTASTARPNDADPLRAGIEAALRRAARAATDRAKETRQREAHGKTSAAHRNSAVVR